MNALWRWMERACMVLALAALCAIVALPVTQVIMREAFSRPIIGLEEFTRWGLICLVFFGAPLLIRTNEQIRLTEFVDALPKALRLPLERLMLLMGGLAFGLTAWVGLRSALANVGTRTPTIDIPFWLFATPMIAGLGAAGVGYLWFAVRREPPPIGGGPTIV